MRRTAPFFVLLLLLNPGCGGDEPTGGYAPALAGALERGSEDRTRGDLRAIAVALNARMADAGGYPAVHGIEELASILEPGYLTSVPRTDAWGAPLSYESTGDGFTLRSPGPDGREGGADDIVLTEGGFP